jgi:multiple sugar transport system substrate-binding protein
MDSMHLTRRSFLRLTAGLSAGALLVGCAPAVAPQGTAGSTGGAAVTPVELSFEMYNFDPWLKALEAMFATYMEQNPNVTVKLESAPWEEFWSRQEARLAAGNPSDLSIGDPGYFGRFAHKGYYQDLEPLVESAALNLDDWFEVTVNDSRYDKSTGIVGQGALFGMPATYVGLILYYNKDMFDAAGAAYPDDTWTRDKLTEVAVALTKDSAGNSSGSAAFNPDDIAQWGITHNLDYGLAVHTWNNGGELINAEQTQCLMTEPAVVEVFEWFDKLLREQHANPTPAQLQGLPNPLQVGKVAMSMDGSWNVDYYVDNLEFNWDIAPVPLGNKGLDRITYAGTNTLHLFKDSAHLDEAWKLLQFMAGPGGMEYFAKTGTPSLRATANSDVYLTGSPENRAVAVNAADYGRSYYPGLKSDSWKQIYIAEREAMLIGQSDASTMLQSVCEKITPILETPVDEL